MFLFDIETARLPLAEHPIVPDIVATGMLPEMPEFEAAKNLKDPEKIQADLDTKRDKWLKEETAKLASAERNWMADASISPDLAKVTAIGYHTDKAFMSFSDDEGEDAVLEEFWERYQHALSLGYPVIGFNHLSFDLPFLYWRTVKAGMGKMLPPMKAWRGQLQFPGDHYDLCAIAGTRPFKGARKDVRYDSLSTVAKCLGFEQKSKPSGQFFDSWPREEQEEYLLRDIQLTREIAGVLLPWLNERAHATRTAEGRPEGTL